MASFTGSNIQQDWQQNNQTTANPYTMNTSRDGMIHEHHNSINRNSNRNNNIDMNSELWRLLHHNFASDSQRQPSQNQNQMNTFSVGTSSSSDQLAQAQLMMAQYNATTSNSGNANSSNSNSSSNAMQTQSNDGMLAILGSKVKPFLPRSSSLDDDADLWKVFDDEVSQVTTKRSRFQSLKDFRIFISN